ncbi:MAG: adenine phosphoribosyltransferase [Lentisphaerae bacterium]|nr:adenine phosphoribosyltransferase [Lentisphaerota bacterium]
MKKDFLLVQIGSAERKLQIVPVSEKVKIAFIKVLGDKELISESSKEFCKRLPKETDLIVGPETGGIVLAHQLSMESGLPYTVIRKKKRPYMTNPIEIPVKTIGTENIQYFHIDKSEMDSLAGKNIAIIDEVVSSGETLKALEEIIKKAGGNVTCKLAIATEGERRNDVKSLCHLPLFS